ncbi:hypothetical protein J5N97_008364 [Dioscorea zingiberensis]|uniref:RRM domain-containing protein n=1 Tax=Dioscorea zingiberensis TaxID=325984 RepID=A0A9D5CVZ7_9LILI|nr:hypothetical protein J5N97_008364 [Dioscorea zingiberensis]
MLVDYYMYDHENGEPPRVTSLQGTVPLPTFTNFGEDMYFVADQRGYESLVLHIAKEFLDTDSKGLIIDPRLKLNKVVRQINQYSRIGVIVTTEDGSVFKADYVMVSVSIGVLQSKLITFTPELPVLQHLDREYPGENILMVVVTDDEARRIEREPDANTKAEAMEVLRDMFGKCVPEATDILIDTCWADLLHWKRMESDNGKLFIGGISWDTNEDRIRDYFSRFGEVVEAVIMKDRTTGRARGFGFIVFADPAVAERVVMEKHMIDGRLVEAKKAIPRDDQNILGRQNNSVHGSPGTTRTKKIFVGGLPSSITGDDFKKYFLQFGPISDVVVMYDHSTQRPRGFGFITFESEDSVDKALFKTFHELNGKMVEVKRAVPKELSPGPAVRSPFAGYNYGMHRINNFINGFPQGFNPSSLAGYGMRAEARFSPLASSRNGYPAFGAGYGMGMNFEPGFNSSFGGNSNYNNSVGYGRGLGAYYGGSPSRYASAIGYGGGNLGTGTGIGSLARNVWGNGGLNFTTNSVNSSTYMTSGSGDLGSFGNSLNWGGSSPPISSQGAASNASYAGESLGFGSGGNNFGLGGNSFGRTSASGSATTQFNDPGDGYGGKYTDLYGSSSVYGDPTWRSGSNDLDGSGPFVYGLGSAASDVTSKDSTGYSAGYSVTNRQHNRGIAS